jgi:membrane protein DedA with SNARE-associated domain
MGSIQNAFKFFFTNLLQMQSSRLQLVWFTAFSWATSHLWFGICIPLIREISIIANPVNMDSAHASAIMNSMDIAFAGTVIAYIASSWKKYQNQTDSNAPKEG